MMAELAASVKAQGRSLHEQLDALYWQHGYHAEHLVNIRMEGSDGMKRMEALMAKLRARGPAHCTTKRRHMGRGTWARACRAGAPPAASLKVARRRPT